MLSAKALDRAVYRIRIALGLRQRSDPVGYSDYLIGARSVFVPEPPAPSQPVDAGRRAAASAVDRPPAHIFATLPQSVRVVLVMPPVYYTVLPPPGSAQACASTPARRL